MSGNRGIAGLVQRFYSDAWNRWEDAALAELLTEDFVLRGSLGDEARGHDGFRSYRDKVRAAFPDFHNKVGDVVAEGDRAAVRLRCTGHQQGEVLGLAPTGIRVAYDAAAFFHSDGARLREAWVLGDLDSLRRQLYEINSA